MNALTISPIARISPLQAAVYEHIRCGKSHLVVIARAGTGKTTTIMGALASVPAGKTIALFAFNKAIAVELAGRAPKGVEVKTLHSHGYSAVRRAFPGVNVNDKKSEAICVDLFGAVDDRDPIRSRYGAIADLVSKAKDTLVKRGDLAALDDMIDTFGIDCPSDEYRDAFVRAAMAVLVASLDTKHGIDFGDMCWLPVVLGLRVWAFDRVFVDETQDLSPSQIELLMLCIKRDGLICAVGDDRQAIYAFRGADVNSIPNLIKRLSATVLPLNETFRCAASIVALAATEVPDFKGAKTTEGEIVDATTDRMIALAAAGDMVVSRTNAPLMSLCLKLLSNGTRATIKGRDVGKGMIATITKSKAKSVPALLAWATAQHKKDCARLAKREKPTDEADDRLACIVALTEGAKGVAEVIARAERLFSDDGDAASRVTLGTTHKLKGLEAARVFMLADTYKRNRSIEDANCWYVAVTRAKDSLYLVSRPQEAAAAPAMACAAE